MLLIDHYTFKKSLYALQESCWIWKHCSFSQRNPCSLEGRRVEIMFICLDFFPSFWWLQRFADGLFVLATRCVCPFPVIEGPSAVGLKVMFPGDWPHQTESQWHSWPVSRRSQDFSKQWTWDCAHLVFSSLPCVLKSSPCLGYNLHGFRPRWLNPRLSQVS